MGNYTFTFKVPLVEPMQLICVAGYESNIATKILTVERPDTEVPTWPAGSTLTASDVTQTSLTLTWTAAEDNKAVTKYNIYQNGTLLDSVGGTTLTYNVTGLTAATGYTFKVEAGDAAGNWSTNGPSAEVTTLEAADTTAPTWPVGSRLTASDVTQTGLTLNWPPLILCLRLVKAEAEGEAVDISPCRPLGQSLLVQILQVGSELTWIS